MRIRLLGDIVLVSQINPKIYRDNSSSDRLLRDLDPSWGVLWELGPYNFGGFVMNSSLTRPEST